MRSRRRIEWSIGKRLRGWLARAQNDRCAGCGKQFLYDGGINPLSDEAITLDHVHPKSKGGTRHLGNVIAVHRRCTDAKGDRPAPGCEEIWLMVVNAKLDVKFPLWRRRIWRQQ